MSLHSFGEEQNKAGTFASHFLKMEISNLYIITLSR